MGAEAGFGARDQALNVAAMAKNDHGAEKQSHFNDGSGLIKDPENRGRRYSGND